jgi:3-deoxy-D-manno-octulosonic acid kinase
MLVCSTAPTDVHQEWFNPAYWQSQNRIVGTSKGRHTTYFFRHNQQDYVLRHYYRGGLFGKLVKDRYWFSTIENTRAYQELRLLEQLRQWDLKVPKPIAAKIELAQGFYRADIIIEKIPGATDAFQRLLAKPLSEDLWKRIGRSIQQLHQHSVYHSDLNIHNIMVDETDTVWIIDFDKCAIRKQQQNQEWKQKNLQRLRRSLEKEKGKNENFHWQEANWQWLLDGYLNP